MNSSSNLSSVKFLFIAGTATIISLANQSYFENLPLPSKSNYDTGIDNEQSFKYTGLKHETMTNVNSQKNIVEIFEPIVKLQYVKKIKIKLGKVQPLRIHSIEDKDGFI
ncbi:MAG: hypothetical protein KAT05_08980 [Spirochaetes bacterium]|nr:hypothetical protein [Spirochaetota bacterium]